MKLLPASLTRAVGRRQLILQKNSPSILFVGGLVGVLGGTVLACRATLKVEPALDQIKKELDDVNATEKVDKNKDVARVYATGGLSLVKLYGPRHHLHQCWRRHAHEEPQHAHEAQRCDHGCLRRGNGGLRGLPRPGS